MARKRTNTRTIKLTLPFPPSVNSYWRHSNRGSYLSKRAKQYREDSRALLIDQGLETHKEPIAGRLTVKVKLHRGDKMKYDLDNCGKAMLDVLHHWRVIEDDEQIDDLRLIRGKVLAVGKAVVEISTST
jgi:crossover junction endodeoxyribonuclease RusA